MRIVFLGTADFGIPALQMLHAQHELAAVVTTPPRQQGRGLKIIDSPIAQYAQQHAICPLLTPESFSEPEFLSTLKSFQADCFVVVAFKLLPEVVFSMPKFGTFNIHASLLPAFRGPAPIHRAIEAGADTTGVTVFKIDAGIDTGAIVARRTAAIAPEMTTPELYTILSRLGADALCEALTDLKENRAQFITQDETRSSKAPKLKKSESLIRWNLDATTIYNTIRAFKPFPGTHTMLKGKRLEIEWAAVETSSGGAGHPGTICSVGDDFFSVQTGNGVLRVLLVKPEGRKSMRIRDFLNGTALYKGMKFDE